MTEESMARVLLRKVEFLHLCNTGQIRILRARVTSPNEPAARMFSVGITTSPTDADNCVVIELNETWINSIAHDHSKKRDLIWLDAKSISRIHCVRSMDDEALRGAVSTKFSNLFALSAESEWHDWIVEESTSIHIDLSQKLLTAIGLKSLSSKELRSPEVLTLVQSMLGLGENETQNSDSQVARFFRELPRHARAVGPTVGTIHSIFIVMRSWIEHFSPESKASFDLLENKKLDRILNKLERTEISVKSIDAQKVAGKFRSLERRNHGLFSKKLRPILMAAVIDTNYKVAGEIFNLEDFRRYLDAIKKFGGSSATQLYVLYVACRLGPEIVNTTLIELETKDS